MPLNLRSARNTRILQKFGITYFISDNLLLELNVLVLTVDLNV